MNNVKYEDVLMQLYPRLTVVSEQLQQKIMRLAIRSFSSFKTADNCADKILKVVESKKKIDELHYLLTQVIKRLSEEEKAIFNYRYYNYRSIDGFDYCSRSYYRKQNNAFSRLRELLNFIGLTEDSFYKNYANIPCVKVIIENHSAKKKKLSLSYVKDIFV
ncbi:MAG: hypothetical protein IJF75_01255 [Clostridia bacterium]|nr:hypothetical protein [Clostridia bacterium]